MQAKNLYKSIRTMILPLTDLLTTHQHDLKMDLEKLHDAMEHMKKKSRPKQDLPKILGKQFNSINFIVLNYREDQKENQVVIQITQGVLCLRLMLQSLLVNEEKRKMQLLHEAHKWGQRFQNDCKTHNLI